MRPIKVAVIGGGCAGMTAAFELTKPELRGRYEVTVYQQGFRLGGKGASGRGASGRIEEHGLHVWMGFYENAFQVMRSAYEELARDPARCPVAAWTDAFTPFDEIGVAQPDERGDWGVWSTIFPPLPGYPGTPLSLEGYGPAHPFSVRGYLRRATEVMLALFKLASGRAGPNDVPRLSSASNVMDAITAGVGFIDSHVAVLQNQLETLVRITSEGLVSSSSALPGLLGEIVAGLDALRARAPGDVHRRRASEVLEVLAVSVVGAFRSGVLTDKDGFDSLDCYDFREFLQIHGASDAAVDSPFVRGLYSLMFAYEDGDTSRPRTAAGQALRGCLRMFFTYRGSLFWKMSAGMGDIVFAPLYQVLERRGAKIAFFHRLRDVGLSGPDQEGARHVSRLSFEVQAQTRGKYDPLVDVGGLPCWPSEPKWELIVGGEELRARGRRFEDASDGLPEGPKRVLEVGRDFDLCVLAIGLAEVPSVCRSILAVDDRWVRMVRNVKTVATQAMQLWLDEPMEHLGWERGPVTITAFAPPFDTWADMTHLLPREGWSDRGEEQRPKAIAYFCNVLDERELHPGMTERQADALVERHGEDFIQRHLPKLWPDLVDAGGRIRAEAIESRYFRGNISRSERYTLSLPGTVQYRISPLDRTYDNLTIAGDWTACGLNLGCVESAVISGRLAAHAISGLPALSDIVGYDHI